MKIRKNNLGYGLLSLALALAFPLNANADEINLTPVDSLTEKADTELISGDEVNMEDRRPAQNPTNIIEVKSANNPQTQPVSNSQTIVNTKYKAQLDFKSNINYISQKGKEIEDKIDVKAYPVAFKEGSDRELSYTFEIKGTMSPEDYTISIFALKDGKVKKFDLNNFIADGKVTLAGQKMAESCKQIAGNGVYGFRINTQIKDKCIVNAQVDLGEEDQAGDYTLYYAVTSKGKTTFGKLDAKVEKDQDNKLSLAKDRENMQAIYFVQAKENPLARLPFTKILLNDTDEEKNLTDYLDLSQLDYGAYKLVASQVDPNTQEAKQEEIDNPRDYKLPANSLIRFDLREKTDTTNPIEDAEIAAFDLDFTQEGKAEVSLMSLMNKKGNQNRVLSPNMEKLIQAEKASLRKLYPNIDPETLEMRSLYQAISKQKSKLKGLMDNGAMMASPVAQIQNSLMPINQKPEEKKKSVVEINAEIEKENREIKALTEELREVTSDIYELIQQALLDYELDSLAALEASDPEAAKEEYKRIAQLVKEAEALGTKANQQLIELDEIILVDNDSDPIVGRGGDKVVLNLGKLTPLSIISDITKDSPLESERNFSKNLQKKLNEAIKKVQTVTIGEKDDAKAEGKPEEQKEDPNKAKAENENKPKDEKNLEEKPNKEEDSKTKEEINPKDETKTDEKAKDDKASKPDDKAKVDGKTDAKSIVEIDNKNEPIDPTKAGETNEKTDKKTDKKTDEKVDKKEDEKKKDKKENSQPSKKKSSQKVYTPIFIRYLQSLNLRSRLIDNK